MNQYPKRLIEVDLPIKRISAHSRREKSIRHGHISTLHIWWARRPLAACRAVICAALWPDPADPLCPAAFCDVARATMLEWTTHERQILLSEESRPRFEAARKDARHFDKAEELRAALLDFIADFANWDNSNVKEYLNASRALTQAAHQALGGTAGTQPMVVDPFAGGGSIPLEALRIGADAFASDINPIPVLLNKVVLEFIPKHGRRLADEVRKWGGRIKQHAERAMVDCYPKDRNGATPIAYIWARTMRCEGPGCGAEVPLMRSLWLAKRGENGYALQFAFDNSRKAIDSSIVKVNKNTVVQSGTLKRGSVTCPLCGFTVKGDRVRSLFKGRHGGADDARLMGVFCDSPSGRFYREPDAQDLEAVSKAKGQLALAEHTSLNGHPALPDESLPYLRSIFNVNLIGIDRWRDLFSARQLLSIYCLSRALQEIRKEIQEADSIIESAVVTLLAFAIDRQADYNTSICTWVQTGEFIGHNFAQGQSLPIKWDFAEAAPFAGGSGSWDGAIDWIVRVIENIAAGETRVGHASLGSAMTQVLPDACAAAVITDPPYYDAIPYSDLSDFFYVWLKRNVGDLYPDMFSDTHAPKREEIVQLAERNPMYAYKTKENFEVLMGRALGESSRVVSDTGIGVFVFAHKQTDAWETMLQALINAGWVATASWPIDTEMAARLRAKGSAALASSVHIVCRHRGATEDNAGDWRDVLAELPRRIHEWMPRLAKEGVVGADAIFACLGPALEIFSRHPHVEKASGEVVTLKEYLVHVWAAVAKEALAQVFKDADTASFEADARLTAMWLWTLNAGNASDAGLDENEGDTDDESDGRSQTKAKGGFVLEYDAARKIAQGLGANLESLDHVIEVSGETARLLPVAERTQYLFGKEQGHVPTSSRKKAKAAQLGLFEELAESGGGESAWEEKTVQRVGETTLDRVHQAMILFAAGRGEAMKRFLVNDGAGNDQRFWSLAQALSALYPQSTTEKRWVDGVLARKKGLGL